MFINVLFWTYNFMVLVYLIGSFVENSRLNYFSDLGICGRMLMSDMDKRHMAAIFNRIYKKEI